ncbi:MAG: hypothetical protein ACJ763_18530 [Bdellovibrionia bacterium]
MSSFVVVMALFQALAANADEVITPPGGKGWGEGTTAESLLNMNRDPESVRKVDPERVPIPIRGTCTDDQGKTYTGDDEDYALCMNRKTSRTKASAPAPASVIKKN